MKCMFVYLFYIYYISTAWIKWGRKFDCKKKLLKYLQKLLENYLSQNYQPTADDISKGYCISTTGIATYHKDDAKVIKHITLVYKSKKNNE